MVNNTDIHTKLELNDEDVRSTYLFQTKYSIHFVFVSFDIMVTYLLY